MCVGDLFFGFVWFCLLPVCVRVSVCWVVVCGWVSGYVHSSSNHSTTTTATAEKQRAATTTMNYHEITTPGTTRTFVLRVKPEIFLLVVIFTCCFGLGLRCRVRQTVLTVSMHSRTDTTHETQSISDTRTYTQCTNSPTCEAHNSKHAYTHTHTHTHT